jgi:ABC-type multidrug transport system fused ATPase/permease subunit
MTKEEKAEGAVAPRVYATYVNSANKPVLLGVIVASFLLSNACQVLQQWTVGAWTSDVNYVKFPLHVYLGTVAGLATGVAVFTWIRAYLVILFGAAASLAMHNRMVTKVLSAPLGFFGELDSSLFVYYIYV